MRSHKLIIILAFSLIINLVLASGVGYFIYQKGGVSYLIEKYSNNHTRAFGDYYLAKLGIFKELPNRTSDIYLVGDSITELAEWHELLSTQNVRNRGISGDTTAGVINRLQEITEGNPSKIFIMCGINNILSNIPASQTIEEYNFIISSFLEMPGPSKIYLESVLPINHNKYKEKLIHKNPWRHVPTNSEVSRINKFLNETAKKHTNIQYVDLTPLTDSTGELISEYTDDGLHLNGKGLITWAKILSPLVNE